MITYHKIFKSDNLVLYLSNPEPIVSCNKKFLKRLICAQNTEELHDAKMSVLNDFQEIYSFDKEDAEFPDPVGYFAGEWEKREFIKKKILLQDLVLYLGNTFGEYHVYRINNEGGLPEIEAKRLAINYREIYCKAKDDYIDAIKSGKQHAITATFVLPALIEQGLSMALQTRMLRQCIAELNELTPEENALISPFLQDKNHIFYGPEEYIMGKVYKLFVDKKVLKKLPDNEMILTGKSKKIRRTLNSLLNTQYAQKELLPGYYELLKDVFLKLNIRNCIMHGLGESFDYLNRGIVAIMFQLLWDIADCEIFRD